MTIIPMGEGAASAMCTAPRRNGPDWPVIVWLAFVAGTLFGILFF
ncbi:hypothetical protein [Stakelama tenebrarum]|nr:hypothetical protein [Sphingosinithalassobacter tenebrarum]